MKELACIICGKKDKMDLLEIKEKNLLTDGIQ